MSSDYYVYGYIRKIASMDGPAGSFYYIGKGMGDRARANHGHIHVPKDPKRIVKIAENLTEEDAFSLEKSQIKEYGRIDNGTGCLRNLTDGGEGPSGYKYTEEQCAKQSAIQKIVKGTPEARVKQSIIMKRVRGTPEARAKQSIISKAVWAARRANQSKNHATLDQFFT